MAPKSLLASWLAAVMAVPLSLFTAAVGQGLGALVAGGSWIGVSTPWLRQAWALVNQPVLNFASLPSATGYWLGSWLLPVAVAAAAMPLSLRLRFLPAQLLVVQAAWTSLVIGAGWQTALDPHLSHLVRWLQFRGWPLELRWITPAVAVVIAVPIAIRLLALARITRYHLSRTRRLGVVAVHLLPVPIGWAVATTVLRGSIPFEACVAGGAPIVVGLVVAWIGYPAPLTQNLESVRTPVLIGLGVCAALAWGAFWIIGRPLPHNKAAALQWGRQQSFNNIRDWMDPRRAPWLENPSDEPRSIADPG